MNFSLLSDWWRLGAGACLFGTLAWISLSDIRYRKISNKAIVFICLSGLFLNAAIPYFPGLWEDLALSSPAKWGCGLFCTPAAPLGLVGSLMGLLVAFFMFLPFYLLGAMGAGDVKLASAVGIYTGGAHMLSLALFIWILGGVFALAWLGIAQPKSRTAVRHFDATSYLPTRWHMPYGAVIAIACVMYWVKTQWSGV